MGDNMIDNYTAIWTRIRDAIRPSMTGMSFHTWIEVIEAVTLENGILVLQLPNRDVMKTVNDLYYDIILGTAREKEPEVSNILFILPEDREKYVNSEQDVKRMQSRIESNLNPKYTFDSFVIGKSNEMAHAAALGVAKNPGGGYNPLFLYGGVGLGKTHLMHAIGHYVLDNNPNANVTYITSESFMNELINAIQSDKRNAFREKYRSVDVLMIDDIQFISKSQSTQEEFFNTFNALYNSNKQIIISSDRPPKELSKLEDRLTSRFIWGLTTDISTPDIETRIAILKKRASQETVPVPEDIIRYIAEHVVSNIRELEGCLNRVISYSQLKREPLNLVNTAAILKDMLPEEKEKVLDPQRIKETVADYYGVSVESMDSERRDKQVVMPRQIAMYLCQELLGLPFKRIAEIFGRNDHTTSMNACKKVANMKASDPAFRTALTDITERLK